MDLSPTGKGSLMLLIALASLGGLAAVFVRSQSRGPASPLL